MIKSSPYSIQAAYVSGFASAEGSVHRSGGGTAISFSQKNLAELMFIKDILNRGGITHISSPEIHHGVYKIKISTRPHIKKFDEFIGFGHHSEKNKKLKTMLRSYKKLITREEYKLKKTRYREILSFAENKNSITAHDVSIKFNLDYTTACRILRDMAFKNLIFVDKTSWPRKYSST